MCVAVSERVCGMTSKRKFDHAGSADTASDNDDTKTKLHRTGIFHPAQTSSVDSVVSLTDANNGKPSTDELAALDSAVSLIFYILVCSNFI